jgi:hypothetical protein
MKKSIIKISSLLVLAIILTVASVQAQSMRRYRAQIPFDFIVGNKIYKTGEYIIRLDNPLNSAVILTIENVQTHHQKVMPVLQNGSRSLVNKTVLMFDRYGDQYVLKQLVSYDFGISAPKPKLKKQFAKNYGEPEQSVAIILAKSGKMSNEISPSRKQKVRVTISRIVRKTFTNRTNPV